MVFDADKYHRSSIRLRDYDCAQEGAYFVTICTRNRECVFGHIADGGMTLNHIGDIVRHEWLRSASIRREIHPDTFVIMPNHLHGIVFILDHGQHSVGATGGRPRSHRITGRPPKRIGRPPVAPTKTGNCPRRAPGNVRSHRSSAGSSQRVPGPLMNLRVGLEFPYGNATITNTLSAMKGL